MTINKQHSSKKNKKNKNTGLEYHSCSVGEAALLAALAKQAKVNSHSAAAAIQTTGDPGLSQTSG